MSNGDSTHVLKMHLLPVGERLEKWLNFSHRTTSNPVVEPIQPPPQQEVAQENPPTEENVVPTVNEVSISEIAEEVKEELPATAPVELVEAKNEEVAEQLLAQAETDGLLFIPADDEVLKNLLLKADKNGDCVYKLRFQKVAEPHSEFIVHVIVVHDRQTVTPPLIIRISDNGPNNTNSIFGDTVPNFAKEYFEGKIVKSNPSPCDNKELCLVLKLERMPHVDYDVHFPPISTNGISTGALPAQRPVNSAWGNNNKHGKANARNDQPGAQSPISDDPDANKTTGETQDNNSSQTTQKQFTKANGKNFPKLVTNSDGNTEFFLIVFGDQTVQETSTVTSSVSSANDISSELQSLDLGESQIGSVDEATEALSQNREQQCCSASNAAVAPVGPPVTFEQQQQHQPRKCWNKVTPLEAPISNENTDFPALGATIKPKSYPATKFRADAPEFIPSSKAASNSGGTKTSVTENSLMDYFGDNAIAKKLKF